MFGKIVIRTYFRRRELTNGKESMIRSLHDPELDRGQLVFLQSQPRNAFTLETVGCGATTRSLAASGVAPERF